MRTRVSPGVYRDEQGRLVRGAGRAQRQQPPMMRPEQPPMMPPAPEQLPPPVRRLGVPSGQFPMSGQQPIGFRPMAKPEVAYDPGQVDPGFNMPSMWPTQREEVASETRPPINPGAHMQPQDIDPAFNNPAVWRRTSDPTLLKRKLFNPSEAVAQGLLSAPPVSRFAKRRQNGY